MSQSTSSVNSKHSGNHPEAEALRLISNKTQVGYCYLWELEFSKLNNLPAANLCPSQGAFCRNLQNLIQDLTILQDTKPLSVSVFWFAFVIIPQYSGSSSIHGSITAWESRTSSTEECEQENHQRSFWDQGWHKEGTMEERILYM